MDEMRDRPGIRDGSLSSDNVGSRCTDSSWSPRPASGSLLTVVSLSEAFFLLVDVDLLLDRLCVLVTDVAEDNVASDSSNKASLSEVNFFLRGDTNRGTTVVVGSASSVVIDGNGVTESSLRVIESLMASLSEVNRFLVFALVRSSWVDVDSVSSDSEFGCGVLCFDASLCSASSLFWAIFIVFDFFFVFVGFLPPPSSSFLPVDDDLEEPFVFLRAGLCCS